MLNFRVSDEEAALLAAYAEEVGQSMTDVVRSFIRSLEGKLKRVKPETVSPDLLPSVPLARTNLVPPVAAVYFILTEGGEVLYVGQSGNMVNRHVDHHRHEEALCIDPQTFQGVINQIDVASDFGEFILLRKLGDSRRERSMNVAHALHKRRPCGYAILFKILYELIE